MHRALLAGVLVLAAACTPSQARKAHRAGEIATAGGLIGILATASVASLVPAHEDTLLTVGVAFVPVSVVGALLYIATDSKVNQDHGPEPTLREKKRATAWELTQQAAHAARDQDCTQVQAIAPRVRELDHDFHSSVFIRDAAIQRCLRER
jgi:hypothetical protein